MHPFNTLVQNGTTKEVKSTTIVTGIGSDLNKKEALKGRAKRKTITQVMMFNLIKIAEDENDLDMVKAYWNTYHCQESVITANDRLYGQYCKNRFCTLCCSIRKAEVINKYYPIIKQWEQPHFITLTVKSCKADKLETCFRLLNKTFSKIIEKYRKREQRGKGKRLMGIK